ncbi:MAG: hypothetical protein HPY57_13245 [Ignavibacteria bacterium]|nr:hypothetical protein [Ignavibacteria bacterium]
MKLTKFPHYKFSYSNSSRRLMISITELWDFENHKPKYPIIGYREDTSHTGLDYYDVINKEDYCGVLFDTSEGEVWCHIPIKEIEQYEKKTRELL